jgi:hypothetical protein
VKYGAPRSVLGDDRFYADTEPDGIADAIPGMVDGAASVLRRVYELPEGERLVGFIQCREHVNECAPNTGLMPRSAVGHGQPTPGLVVDQLALRHIDVTAKGEDVATRRRLVVFADEPPFDIGPVSEARVSTGAIPSVTHVMNDERLADIGLGKKRVERDEQLPNVVLLVQA